MAIGELAGEGSLLRHATFYGGCVGPPSDGKTPAQKLISEAIRRIGEILAWEYAEALQRWEDECPREF